MQCRTDFLTFISCELSLLFIYHVKKSLSKENHSSILQHLHVIDTLIELLVFGDSLTLHMQR